MLAIDSDIVVVGLVQLGSKHCDWLQGVFEKAPFSMTIAVTEW